MLLHFLLQHLFLLRFSLLCFATALSQAETTHIAVASNFTVPMQQIVTAFESETDHKVILSFGSSGKFFAQINHGAPFDVFFSADQKKPQALQEQGLVAENSRMTYAIGVLTLWTPGQTQPELLLERLHKKQFHKLALANPLLAPYGAAAVETLEKLHLREATESHWVRGENIAQTFQFVSTGNAELGFVALSQIVQDGKVSQGTAWQVPCEFHQPIKQDVVLLKKGEHNPAAVALIQFINSGTAKQIIRSFGYSTE